MTDIVDYSRPVVGTYRRMEVDGDGCVEIEYTQYNGYSAYDEMLSVEFEDIERAYFTARAHRDAYQAYRDRDFEDVEQYELDFNAGMNNEE